MVFELVLSGHRDNTYPVPQGFSQSEAVGLPSGEAWKNVSLPPSVYLLSFAQFLDACGVMIMLFDPTDTRHLSQDCLILLFDITLHQISPNT